MAESDRGSSSENRTLPVVPILFAVTLNVRKMLASSGRCWN